jgi:hypothetical protein
MQINIEKRHLVFFGLILAGLIAIVSSVIVYAYNSGNPAYVGHTTDEIEGLQSGSLSCRTVTASGTGTATAQCNSDEIVTGGGCTSKLGTGMVYTNSPTEDGKGWYCSFSNYAITANARCCKLGI